jgi:predicted CoA-binding protein
VFTNPDDESLRAVLTESRSIAVVGLSPKSDRDSHRVALYLQGQGYKIVPVYPSENYILGERVFRQLTEIPFAINIVNVFRRSEAVLPVVAQSLTLKPRAVWLQAGAANKAAVELCKGTGIILVMDRCIMKEHRRLTGERP